MSFNMSENSLEESMYTPNPFFRFHNDYRARRKSQGHEEPVNVTAEMAGREWWDLPWIERWRYIAQARSAEYDRENFEPQANYVLNCLRKAFKSEDEIDLRELQQAAGHMQSLKQAIGLEEFLSRNTDL